jgi:hypothetical protein
MIKLKEYTVSKHIKSLVNQYLVHFVYDILALHACAKICCNNNKQPISIH